MGRELEALVHFWTAVILRAPKALTQALADSLEGRDPLFAASWAGSSGCAWVPWKWRSTACAAIPRDCPSPRGSTSRRCSATHVRGQHTRVPGGDAEQDEWRRRDVITGNAIQRGRLVCLNRQRQGRRRLPRRVPGGGVQPRRNLEDEP